MTLLYFSDHASLYSETRVCFKRLTGSKGEVCDLHVPYRLKKKADLWPLRAGHSRWSVENICGSGCGRAARRESERRSAVFVPDPHVQVSQHKVTGVKSQTPADVKAAHTHNNTRLTADTPTDQPTSLPFYMWTLTKILCVCVCVCVCVWKKCLCWFIFIYLKNKQKTYREHT